MVAFILLMLIIVATGALVYNVVFHPIQTLKNVVGFIMLIALGIITWYVIFWALV